MTERPTPRTDAACDEAAEVGRIAGMAGMYGNMQELARQLERELSEAREELDLMTQSNRCHAEDSMKHLHRAEAAEQKLERRDALLRDCSRTFAQMLSVKPTFLPDGSTIVHISEEARGCDSRAEELQERIKKELA